MQIFTIFILCIPLLYHSANGNRYRNFLNEESFFGARNGGHSSSRYLTDETVNVTEETFESYSDDSAARAETDPEVLTNESSSQTDQTYFTQAVSDISPIGDESSSDNTLNPSTHKLSTDISGNATHSNSSSFSSSSTTKETVSTNSSVVPSTQETNGSSPETVSEGETEGVARGKPPTTESANATTSIPKTIYQKTIELISDTYTLSILVPVAAGIIFASSIIVTIAICRCFRRRCFRRRLRRKVLPESVKNLRPSDRARLLAESSDEEF